MSKKKGGKMKCFSVWGEDMEMGIYVISDYGIQIGGGRFGIPKFVPIKREDRELVLKKPFRCASNFKIVEVDIETVLDPNGNFQIIAPKNLGRKEDRALIFWAVPSGFMGNTSIYAGDGVNVLCQNKTWHSFHGQRDETAEILVVMRPGQVLYAEMTGSFLENNRAELYYDGKFPSSSFWLNKDEVRKKYSVG